MSKGSVLINKSFLFAIRIVKLCHSLMQHQKEFLLTKQILRSGTSIGALLREAEHAESRKDFLHKLTIALKEANETVYWIDILHCGGYLDDEIYESIKKDAEELLRMLISSIKTIKLKSFAN
jgi:four helix bundle protein